MNRVLSAAAVAGALMAGVAGPAAADYIYATSVTPSLTDNVAAGRGTANDRANSANALGAPDGKFFEIGLNGYVDFTFSSPFTGPGLIFEVTFGDRENWPEFAEVLLGYNGVFTPLSGSATGNADGMTALNFGGGPFDTIRLLNAAGTIETDCGGYLCGGFDVDAIAVTPFEIPLPASVLMLVGALASLGLLRLSVRSV